MSETDDAKAAAAKQGVDAPYGLPVLPPLTAVIEILLLVVVPGLLDLLVPSFPSLNETQPHFFWLPVLLLTLQYGSASGLLAAGSAILLSSFLGWPEQEIGENHFSYLLRIWLQPVLWIATAVVLGQLRQRQIERKDALGRAVVDLANQRHAIAEHAKNLRQRCDRLERVIAVRHAPDAGALLAALGRIQSSDADLATQALGEALSLAFGQSAVSVLVIEGGELRVTYRHAPPDAPAAPEAIGPSSPLFRAVALEGRSLSALAAGAEHDLDGRGLAAAPILGAEGGVIGAVLLETGRPADIDAATTDRLAAIAAIVAGRLWLASSTARPRPVAALDARPATGRALWRRVRRQADRHRPSPVRSGRKA